MAEVRIGPSSAYGPSRQAIRAGEPLAVRLARLREARGTAIPDLLERVRDVVVVASSSRGGSSMLSELLRASEGLVHLRAEVGPFLRLAGLAYPTSGTGSDRLDAVHAHRLVGERRATLADDLSHDAGVPCPTVDDDRFGHDVAWRILVQWPHLDLDPLAVARTAQETLAATRLDEGWGRAELRDPVVFQHRLLAALCRQGAPLSPMLYDMPRPPAGGLPGRLTAPGGEVVEEPPFVLPRGWRHAAPSDLDTKPLVIKTPSNAYRLGFLRALFPTARIRVVHLVRNPAAAINGLVDGWRHRGFHAHRMPVPLRIGGYADDPSADRRWWKFDLPPGWLDYSDAPLMRVCAFQWCAAHEAILEGIEKHGLEHTVVRFEDLAAAPSRSATLARVCDWLGVPFDPHLRRVAAEGIPPVMATAPPQAGRWRSRAEAVRSVIDTRTRDLAERLGYGSDAEWS